MTDGAVVTPAGRALAGAELTADPGEWWRDVAALHAAASRCAAEASDEDRPGRRAPQ